jgi:hypothetical protein
MDKIGNHLEFLGYEIKPLQGEAVGLLATSNKYLNFAYQEKAFGCLFTYLFPTNGNNKKDSCGMLNAVNKFNTLALISRCYVTGDYVIVDAMYPLSYDKTTFGTFIDILQQEALNVHANDGELKNYLA